MIFIEVMVPTGALNAEQRRRLGERIIPELMGPGYDHAPASVIEAGMAMSQVIVHEASTWFAGEHPVDPDMAPRYLVRVTVPEEWRQDMSAHAIATVTRVLADVAPNGDRLLQTPVVWVHVIGIPEGCLGTRGQALRSTDLVRMITDPWRESEDAQAAATNLPPGMALDPVCGMTVPLLHARYTLELNGTTHAFCSAGCLEVFKEDIGAA